MQGFSNTKCASAHECTASTATALGSILDAWRGLKQMHRKTHFEPWFSELGGFEIAADLIPVKSDAYIF